MSKSRAITIEPRPRLRLRPGDRLLVMPEGFHPPLEEYLEAIHELGEEGMVVIQARLAERLGHSAPAVSEMIRRLRDEGYVELRGRSLLLTEPGQALAESVVRKHRLAERLLTDIIGLPWEKAHVEAGRWEHVISDEVEARLIELLGHPTTCPHGNPIPGSGGSEPLLRALSESRRGDHVRLERVTEQVEIDGDSLAYLSAHGFLPGTEATVESRAPDGTLTLDLGAQTIALGPSLSQQLFVTAA
jgi:DtxR family Mn-dependent transcriptional regulator